MLSREGNTLKSDIAMFYYTLGSENFEKEERESLHNILITKGVSLGLTEDELQECWEVYVYLLHYRGDLWRLEPSDLPASYLGKYSFVREWDYALYRCNLTILSNEWHYITIDKWDRYRDLYDTYKRLTGRKLLLCMGNYEKIKNLTEVNVNSYKYLTKGRFSKIYAEYYKDAVFYDIDEAFDEYKSKNKIELENTDSIERYNASNNDVLLMERVFMRGISMYIDLLVGHDWGDEENWIM